MTTPATLPLRLQVVNRVIAVLEAITQGADYWFTPAVVRRHLAPREVVKFPVYAVFPGEGRDPEELSGEVTEEFEIVIKGAVQSNTDTVTEQEKAIADIRKAIDRDSRVRTTGTLGSLAISVRIGSSATDEGEYVSQSMGFFEQRLKVQIASDPFSI
jgi:hypothetical protein